MELMLDKKIIERYEKIFCETVINEESTEIIIPDRSPDVLRIIKGTADAYIKDKNIKDGKVDITGSIKGAILYIAHGEKEVRKLDVLMPFAYVIDAKEATPSAKLLAKINLRNFDVHENNPRKLSARATVEITVSGYEKRTVEICSDISDENKNGIYIKKREIDFYQPTHIQEKSFIISDDIELEKNENELSSILTSSVNLLQTDMKIIGNKAIIKGIAEISYVYKLCDGQMQCGEYELPFSQIIDIEGMNEDNDLKNVFTISGFELEPQYDATGKARYMTVSISAEVQSFVWTKESVEMIDDLYSLSGKMSAKHTDIMCMGFSNKADKRVPVTESIETGMGIKRVLDVGVRVTEPVRRREENEEKLFCDAVINVMYIGEDDGVYNSYRRKSITCPVSVMPDSAYETGATVRGKSYSVGAGNEINVRFFTDFDVTEIDEVSVPVITAVELSEEENEKASNFTVSVVRLSHDYDIWTLAKENLSTVEEIKLANNIVEETVLSEGRMVLIPKKA